MNRLFQEDSTRHRELFHFLGLVSEVDLDAWGSDLNLVIPDDLKAFWRETGGGEIFESETILSPFGRIALGVDVRSVNQFNKGQGMPILFSLTGGSSRLRGHAGILFLSGGLFVYLGRHG